MASRTPAVLSRIWPLGTWSPETRRLRGGVCSVLLLGSLSLGCGKKAAECDALLGGMNSLSDRVNAAQRTADQPNAKPADLVSVLAPLTTQARALSTKLREEKRVTASIQRLAEEFAQFSGSLADESEKMSTSATKLERADEIAAGLEEAQKGVEATQAALERVCTATPADCLPIADLLTKLPAGPGTADDPAAVQKWRLELATWLGQLEAVQIAATGVKENVTKFAGAWRKVSDWMGQLSALTETARLVEASGKRFDLLIDQANVVISSANRECGRVDSK